MNFGLTQFWSSDRSLTALLLFLVAVVFVLYPLGDLGVIGNMVLSSAFSLILISGVMSVTGSYVSRLLLTGLVVANLTVRWLRVAWGVSHLGAWDALLSLACCAALAAIVMIQVFRQGPVTIHRIQGAVAVYLLMGLMWAFAYELIELGRPGAFSFPAHFVPRDPGAPSHMPYLVYFSFVTLTTVGFGDVTPVYPLARSLANLEALVGQLFPAILLARLVSMEVYHRTMR